ncbi:hydrogenase formation protein HypD [Candidatus Bathyarchaeota archaeon]|nr:hydrogenase formation protein HypD [Candidatus Bathyarchaeota archaeon]
MNLPTDLTSGYRDPDLASKICRHIRDLAGRRHFLFMHVCGTHEATIVRHGLRAILPRNVEVRAGPGCPVCVTNPGEIDAVSRLSVDHSICVTSFGDMLRVPGIRGSLEKSKSQGADIRLVYSIRDAVKMAQKDPGKEFIHFSIGFETTAPITAAELIGGLPHNFSVFSSHKLIPPAMESLLKLGEVSIDGFICPGHVSTIIGLDPYKPISKEFKVPQVIAGFEPLDVLIAIAMILRQIKDGRTEVENGYKRSVRPHGNRKALSILEEVFRPHASAWRGFGVIPQSGLELKDAFSEWDAAKRFQIEGEIAYEMPEGCRCGEVVRGAIYPRECPLFNTKCTPSSPVGPCAVGREGACYIAMRYGSKNGGITSRGAM